MAYYKPGIGKSPFFTKNTPIRVPDKHCERVRERLKSANILAATWATADACMIASPSPAYCVMDILALAHK